MEIRNKSKARSTINQEKQAASKGSVETAGKSQSGKLAEHTLCIAQESNKENAPKLLLSAFLCFLRSHCSPENPAAFLAGRKKIYRALKTRSFVGLNCAAFHSHSISPNPFDLCIFSFWL